MLSWEKGIVYFLNMKFLVIAKKKTGNIAGVHFAGLGMTSQSI
jgi:hypothetical protein